MAFAENLAGSRGSADSSGIAVPDDVARQCATTLPTRRCVIPPCRWRTMGPECGSVHHNQSALWTPFREVMGWSDLRIATGANPGDLSTGRDGIEAQPRSPAGSHDPSGATRATPTTAWSALLGQSRPSPAGIVIWVRGRHTGGGQGEARPQRLYTPLLGPFRIDRVFRWRKFLRVWAPSSGLALAH